ncbi:Maf family protein [Marinomonas algicola]|uniref:Maf family protein n=1 Tax=Marinomonas algicola TaxID=2773454 RepID=UPI0023D96784|nr:Maf family protein [Marinomonas algicola]
MVILGSASPRRQELLALLVADFSIVPANIDESLKESELADDYVLRMASEKAHAAFIKWSQSFEGIGGSPIVIGADTSVVVDGKVLGKPNSFDEAYTMLRSLSGRSHQVMTAVCLFDSRFKHYQTANVVTDVTFRVISDLEIEQYWKTGEPKDKAGSYAIQGLGSVFVSSIVGSYSAVVGLPLFETAQLFESLGIHPLQEISHE